ncbi:MAG: ImmA/IrrE family metallo-endopeptidase [Candidatus Thorarchaeota archaeon]|jgi:hypothetical protein
MRNKREKRLHETISIVTKPKKSRNDSEIERLLFARSGFKEPIVAVTSIIRNILSNERLQGEIITVPVQLEDLGEIFSIREFHIDSGISMDALLSPVSGGFNIKVRGSLVTDRFARFSCAHEMTHTLFYDNSATEEGGTPFRAVPIGSALEELLCDIGASEIIMPREPFEKKAEELAKTHRDSIATSIVALSDIFMVSVPAVASRLFGLLDMDNMVATIWQRDRAPKGRSPVFRLQNVIRDRFSPESATFYIDENAILTPESSLYAACTEGRSIFRDLAPKWITPRKKVRAEALMYSPSRLLILMKDMR